MMGKSSEEKLLSSKFILSLCELLTFQLLSVRSILKCYIEITSKLVVKKTVIPFNHKWISCLGRKTPSSMILRFYPASESRGGLFGSHSAVSLSLLAWGGAQILHF